jgi:beta-glucosidase
LAREAVRKSAVLLQNVNNTLPIAKDTPLIYVAGLPANDIGLQSGGWTITWQGKPGALTTGTTILDGVNEVVDSTSRVEYNRFGDFSAFVDEQGAPLVADVGIVVIAEKPYAEGVGDRGDLRLPEADVALIEHVKQQSRKIVVILLSGRPLVVTEQLPQWDAFVAAFLPGSEGAGVADVLFGDYDFTGQLSYSWPRSNEQLPFDFDELPSEGCEAPLYPYGFGLSVKDESPELLECPVEP